MKKIVLCIMGLSLVLMSCSNRPALTKAEEVSYNEVETLIKTSKSDIESAKKAGAEKYAKEMILSAESSLKTAESTLQLKDFVKAKELAQKASLDAKTAISLPIDAKNIILEAEVEVNKSKDAKSDEEAPNEFKSANELLESAKDSMGKNDYKSALESARSSIEFSRKSIEEPATVKALVLQLEDNLKMAKDLEIDQLSGDVYKSANDGLESAKTNLSAHDNAKAKELAEKSSNDIKEEMKKVVNLVVEQAKIDLNSAKESGASEFSSDLLAVAEGDMSNAVSLLEKGDFVNAKASAAKVSSTSKEATTKAQAGKEAKTISEGGTTAETPVVTPEATTTTIETTPSTSETTQPSTAETPTTETVPSSTELASPVTEIPKPAEKPKKPSTKKKPSIPAEEKAPAVSSEETSKSIEEVPLTASSTTATKSKFPIVYVIVILGVLILLVLIIRTVRKKVTASTIT